MVWRELLIGILRRRAHDRSLRALRATIILGILLVIYDIVRLRAVRHEGRSAVQSAARPKGPETGPTTLATFNNTTIGGYPSGSLIADARLREGPIQRQCPLKSRGRRWGPRCSCRLDLEHRALTAGTACIRRAEQVIGSGIVVALPPASTFGCPKAPARPVFSLM